MSGEGSEEEASESEAPAIELGFQEDGETIAIFPVELADDVVIHLASGVPGLSGDYRGRDQVALVLQAFSKAVNSNLSYDLLHIWPDEPEPSDDLVLSVARMTFGSGGAADAFTQVAVGRRVNERIVEAWVISSSLGHPSASAVTNLAGGGSAAEG